MAARPLFQRVAIVGLGLIGGSLGMAIRRRRLAGRVVGLSRHRSTLAAARQRGAIDEGSTDPAPVSALREADLLVIATPVHTIVPIAAWLSRFLRPGAIITDVGSTKAQIMREAVRELPDSIAFVGAHPIAGSEQRGIAAARADLFDGSCAILTPTARTDRYALARVARLWRRIAGSVITMSPAAHDRLLAGASHLPHVLAYSLALSADRGMLPRAPRSLLDMTRLAESDPDLWDDIFFSNRAELLSAIDRFDRQLHRLRRRISDGAPRALKRMLATAQARRHALQTR